MPEIFALSGADVGRSFEVRSGGTFGRSPECAVRLKDRSISRRHAHLEETSAGWFLVDDGSRNGVLVGGERRERVALADGAELHLGEVLIRFRVEATPGITLAQEPAPATPPADAGAPVASEVDLDVRAGAETAIDEELELEDEIELEEEPEIVAGGGAGVQRPAAPRPRPTSTGGTGVTERAGRSEAPARPATAGAASAPDGLQGRVQGRGLTGRMLQYHRIEDRGGGFLSADLSQYPIWVRGLAYAAVLAIAAGLTWLAFIGIRAL